MKLYSGKRIGQSRQELTTAIFFSLFLHLVFSIAVLLLYTVTPKKFSPPLYAVNLVTLSSEQPAGPQTQSPPAPAPQAKTAAKEKQKRSVRTVRQPQKKGSLSDLTAQKKKQVRPENLQPDQQTRTAEDVPEERGVQPAGKENVAIATTQQDFKFGWYLDRVRSKIGQNWNPPPDAIEAKARVVFSINRSGWVGEVNLVGDQSMGTFGFKQAAVRAIHASNPFPPLPDEFSRQTLEFTVDLMAVE